MNLEKNNKMSIDEKKEIWLKAWIALVQTDGLKTAIDVAEWADDCVEQYEKRFYLENEE